ncbi:hypothetical protein NMY22_g9799 [Coprinellus aureogranulatus]|nr:hypothetical protein NMY22_g9799 [Coprinellus aureogranulatus]
MSSPPPIDFPTSDLDAEMEDGTAQPAPNSGTGPLFLPGTPSAAGTPARHRGSDAPGSDVFRSAVARRAVGLPATPRRGGDPLFLAGGSSSPMAFPSSSPSKTPRRPQSNVMDSDPLQFPSSPAAAVTQTPRHRRGDIHPSINITPSTLSRRARRTPGTRNNDNLNSDGTNLDIPMSSAPNLSAAPRLLTNPMKLLTGSDPSWRIRVGTCPATIAPGSFDTARVNDNEVGSLDSDMGRPGQMGGIPLHVSQLIPPAIA